MRSLALGGVGSGGRVTGGRLATYTKTSRGDAHPLFRLWPLPAGEPKTLGRRDWSGDWDIDDTGTWLTFARGRTLVLRRLDEWGSSPERVVGQLRGDLLNVAFLHSGDHIVSRDTSYEIRLWSTARGGEGRVLENVSGSRDQFPAPNRGARLAFRSADHSVHSWDIRDPPDAEPVVLRRPEANRWSAAFEPSGPWLATNGLAVALWPLSSPSARPLRGHKGLSYGLSFSLDGRWLASCPPLQPALLFPLDPSDGGMRTLVGQRCAGLAVHPAGTQVLVGAVYGAAALYPIAGKSPRPLVTGWEGAVTQRTPRHSTVRAVGRPPPRWTDPAPPGPGVPRPRACGT